MKRIPTAELTGISQSGSPPAGYVFRAQRLDTTAATIERSGHVSSGPRAIVLTPALRAKLERYMASHDPDFEARAAAIIGLYLNPPQPAAVFRVDEKTAIQALDRLEPLLPLSPGRAERHGFEDYRHGTLSLYSALNTKTGKVPGKTAAQHTSEQFVDFLGQVAEWYRAVPKGAVVYFPAAPNSRFGIIAWTPLVPSTSCVMSRSTPTLVSA